VSHSVSLSASVHSENNSFARKHLLRTGGGWIYRLGASRGALHLRRIVMHAHLSRPNTTVVTFQRNCEFTKI
jgi:hypothetical protein